MFMRGCGRAALNLQCCRRPATMGKAMYLASALLMESPTSITLPKTLIILVTYNGAKWLSEVLDSLGVSEAYDVWARDNGSQDNTLILQKHPTASFVSAGDNVGFGVPTTKACCLPLTKGTILCFC